MNLNEAIKNIKSNKDAENFLKDLGKYSYRDIASKLNTSTTTVTRVARFLFNEENKGYLKILKSYKNV